MPLVILEKDGVNFCKASSSDVTLALLKSFAVITETGTGLSVMRWCVPVPVTTTWPILVKLSCSLIRRFFSPPFVVIDLGV